MIEQAVIIEYIIEQFKAMGASEDELMAERMAMRNSADSIEHNMKLLGMEVIR